MCRELIFSALILAFCVGAAQGYTILVVSDCQVPGVAGGDHEDDELVSFLEGLGHTVDTSGMDQQMQGTFDAADQAAITACDLIIVTRRTSSGSYNEPAQWNGVEKPLILCTGYLTRDSRWNWAACGSGDAGNTAATIDVEAGQEGHPFLTGLSSPIQVFDWSTAPTAGQTPKGVYLPSCDFVAGITLIGRFDGRPMVADIPTGTTLANGDVAGERRVFFGHWGYDIDLAAPFNREANWDDFITDDYKTILKNIINDILGLGVKPEQASEPSPADQDPDAPYKMVLGWTPGAYAPATNGHKVYFSKDLDDVSNGIGGTILNSNHYPASGTLSLDFSTSYYWRVDEANVPTSGWDEGNIWQFTTEPIAYRLPGQTITATASSENSANEEPDNTINGSGLDADDLHSVELTDMWLSNAADANAAWIQYEFDKVYKLHQMLVWNHNTALEPAIGFGVNDATIEYSINGANWTALGTTHEFARAPGAAGYAADIPVDFAGAAAKYVKITANSNWGGIPGLTQCGLSEVRFFYIPVLAREPNPMDGATDVLLDVVLGWRLGREAAEHDVYFSTKRQAVANSTALVGTVTETSSGPLSLDLGQTYYWKINEVNMAETPTTWEGDVWSFTTPLYFVVEDFEDYNDFCNRIFYTWTDGWGHSGDPACGVAPYGGNGSGSTMGYLAEPYAEQTITHDGSFQSMPFEYLNDGSTGKALYSETERAFDPAQDWTRRGVKALTLWFQGYPASVGSFSYDPVTGIYTMTAEGWDIWAMSDGFHYAFKRLSGLGTIEAHVLSVSNTNEWTKAGLMIRETLDANSVYASALITPLHGIRFQMRTTTGGDTTRTFQDGITAPQWLRLERGGGDTYTVSYSPDGSPGSWTQVGEPVIVGMNTNPYIGLALTSHVVDAMATAEFSDVTMTGTVTGQWQSQDIGITSNVADQLYVAVEDSAGKSKVVNHPDPNAVLSDTWQPWDIDLNDFSDAGVNIQSVRKMYIGVGDRDNPKLGGAGMLYIDDIRLHPATCVLSRRSADFARLDFVEDCEVNYRELEAMAGVWLQSSPWEVDGGYDGSACLHFDGIDNQVYAAEVSTPTSAFTIAFWFNSDNALDSDSPRADFVYWQSPARPHVTFNRSGTGEIGVWPAIAGDFDGPLTTTNSWSADTWYFIVGTFDGTDFKIYVGEDLENTVNHPGAHDAASGLFIGSNRGNGNNFDGKIDDFRIYDYALSDAEIANLANAAGEPVIGPMVWYKFDETSGDIAYDSSGNGYDAEVLFDRLTINLYEDDIIDFKDFAVLTDGWLEQELWP